MRVGTGKSMPTEAFVQKQESFWLKFYSKKDGTIEPPKDKRFWTTAVPKGISPESDLAKDFSNFQQYDGMTIWGNGKTFLGIGQDDMYLTDMLYGQDGTRLKDFTQDVQKFGPGPWR